MWCDNLLQIVYVIIRIVYYLIVVMQVVMFARAIMSWLMPEEDNALVRFITIVTDPIIIPVRMILEKFEFVRSMPIDISFMVAFILLVIIQNILPAVF